MRDTLKNFKRISRGICHQKRAAKGFCQLTNVQSASEEELNPDLQPQTQLGSWPDSADPGWLPELDELDMPVSVPDVKAQNTSELPPPIDSEGWPIKLGNIKTEPTFAGGDLKD